MSIIPNTVTYTHFIILVSNFKLNFTDKCFMNNIINQVIRWFHFKLRPYDTHINISFENNEFRPTNLALNVCIIFLFNLVWWKEGSYENIFWFKGPIYWKKKKVFNRKKFSLYFILVAIFEAGFHRILKKFNTKSTK